MDVPAELHEIIARYPSSRFVRDPFSYPGRIFEVETELAAIVPGGALRAGSVVVVGGSSGATTLLLRVIAGALKRGSWVAIVGVADLGVEAVSETGLPLDRLVMIPHPSTRWVEAVAVLLRSLDVVVLDPPSRCRALEARRMAALARSRGSLLVVVESSCLYAEEPKRVRSCWPEPADVRFEAISSRWEEVGGLGDGHGVLGSREIGVRVRVRRLGGVVRTGVIRCAS